MTTCTASHGVRLRDDNNYLCRGCRVRYSQCVPATNAVLSVCAAMRSKAGQYAAATHAVEHCRRPTCLQSAALHACYKGFERACTLRECKYFVLWRFRRTAQWQRLWLQIV